MDRAKINELSERAHVVHEIPYEASVVDPSVVAVHKQRVFDRYLFAELIVKECIACLKPLSQNHSMVGAAQDTIKEHFGVEE